MTARKQDLDQLMASLRPKLPGASDAGIKVELFNVCKEFFDESCSWQEDLTLNSVADVDTYTLVPTSGQIVRLSGVVDENGLPLPAVLNGIGLRDAEIKFANPFSGVQEFTATVQKTVLIPTDKDDFPIVPDWLLPLWGGGIIDGVLGKMHNEPAKPYSSETKARYHLSRFNDAVQKATVAMLRRHTTGTQAWRFPGFAKGSQRGGSGRTDRRFA